MRSSQSLRPTGKSNTTDIWPHRCLKRVPKVRGAYRLAEDIRAGMRPCDPSGPLGDLAEICRAGGFRIIERELSGARGGVEAMLLPQPRNRFRIWVDPTPPGGWERIEPTIRPAVRRHRVRFRVAHEIAHSFFYRRDGGLPRRVVLDSPEQEAFADAFAHALLVPPEEVRRTRPTPENVVGLHERYDVSLQVVVRAVAEVHPHLSAALLYWPAGASAGTDSAELQWCTPDLRGSWRTAAAELAGDNDRRVSAKGRGLSMPDRRQLLWISSAAPLRGAPAPC